MNSRWLLSFTGQGRGRGAWQPGVFAGLLLASGWLLAAPVPTTCSEVAQANGIVPAYIPALPGYDFTAGIQRWGGAKDRALVQTEKTVGNIYINTLPIFDTANAQENNFLYRWANRVHTFTRPIVIERMLLFSPGEQVDERLLDESERILRRQNYVSDSAIRVVRECGETVDLEVITREVWSLTPEISIKSSGGDTSGSLGFRDSNFLGSGKSISMAVEKEPERDKLLMNYNDPNFQGKRINISGHLEDNSDGFDRRFAVSLPFYALDTRRSWGAHLRESELTRSQYVDAVKISALQVQERAAGVFYGTSRGLVDGEVNRYLFGLQFEQQRYRLLPDEIAPAEIADDLDLAYPYVEYQHVEDKYKIGFNINQIKRSEDIHVGRTLRARLGYSGWGGQRLVTEGVWHDTWLARDKMLLQSSVDWHGRWNVQSQAVEDAEVNVGVKFHREQTASRSLVLSMDFAMLKNPPSHYELTLGGDKGLRGYRSRYLSGDTTLLFAAEQRWYTKYEPFGLFNVGFAAFADVGRALFRGVDGPNDGWKADVGVGLRLIPSKADKEQVIHLDIAFPVNDSNSGRSMLISAEVKKTL